MSATVTIWRMHLTLLRNAVRYDTRMRVALAVGLAFSVVIGLWSAGQLSLHLHQWHLSLVVEGMTQTMLQEETPIPPRRMWLLNLGLVTFAAMVLLLWKFLPVLALTALAVLDVGIVVVMWHFSRVQLGRVIQRG